MSEVRAGKVAAAAGGALVLPLCALHSFHRELRRLQHERRDQHDREGTWGPNVVGLQTTITLFTLTMAALMIPGSKLSDIWGTQVLLPVGPDPSTDQAP